MGLAIGIDLGTSTSAAAVYRRGKVESLPIEGKKIMPSVISCKPDGTMLIGHSAKSRLYIDPLNTISSSKRHMGDETKTYTVNGRLMTPVDAAKEILSKIKTEAEKYLGEPVNDAVITIPAYFTSEQREATKKAGELAGFRVLRLLSEPTAAAIAYGLDKEKDQTIMVYDLGGGTFDISILKVEHNRFDVVAVDGDSLLGGDDFDNVIVQHLLRQASVSPSLQTSQSGSISMQRLKEAAEEAKKELAVSDVADITIPDIFNTHIDEELTIEKFTSMIDPLLTKTTDKMKEVLQAAGLTKRDISRVILVGGSTRMRAVREAVTKEIKQPFIADNVDEIVAHGAAIMAANLSAPEKDMAPVPIDVQEAVPHSFGVGMFLNDVWSVKHLISRNDKLPALGSTLGFTRYAYQDEVDLPVYRQETVVPDEEKFLGKLTIGVRSQKDPVALSAIFELNENGILVLSSSELPSSSPIIRQYIDTGEVNIPLLRDMIDSKQIQVKSVKIDTTK